MNMTICKDIKIDNQAKIGLQNNRKILKVDPAHLFLGEQ